ncbi:Hypothetical_protein [Hexamita inflata]|uniref:Hypothetical_protein n=1 Tax=Hexamita inflata TaxID=28002 RepID=A0AA86TN86_9EUKA|nr:Hypothetical protein HINF_LOCUS10186 [Hexamita inflata]
MNKHNEAAFQNESVPTQQYLLKQGKGNKEIKIINPDLQKRDDKNANFSVKNFIQLKGAHAMKILMKCSIGIRSITIIKTNFPIGARRHKRSITLYQTVNQSITFPTHDHKLIPNPFYPKRNLFSVYVCLNILV